MIVTVLVLVFPMAVLGADMDTSGNSVASLVSEYSDHDVRVISSVTAEQLDSVLKGTLSGMGSAYVEAGKANGIDPAFLAALSISETGNGSAATSKPPLNNAGGITCGSASSCGTTVSGGTKWRKFGSIEESIRYKAELLKRSYIDAGLYTIVKIQGKYAPIGASNDPNNVNSNWVKNIASYMKKFKVAVNKGGGETKDTKDSVYSDGSKVGSYFEVQDVAITNVGVDDRTGKFSSVNEYGAFVLGGKIGQLLFSIAQVMAILLIGVISFYWLLGALAFGGVYIANEWLHKLTFSKVDVYDGGFGVLLKYTIFAFVVAVFVVSGLIPTLFAWVYQMISDFIYYIDRFTFM